MPWLSSNSGFRIGAATPVVFAALGLVFKLMTAPAAPASPSWLRNWLALLQSNMLTACTIPVISFFLLAWLKQRAFPEYWRRALMVFQDPRSPDFTLDELSRGQRTKLIASFTAAWSKATVPRYQDSHKAAAMFDPSCVVTIETNEGAARHCHHQFLLDPF